MSSFLVRTATGPGLTTRPNTRPGHTTRLTNRPGHTTRLNTRPGHTTRRKGMYQQRLTVRRLRLLGICIFGPMLASASYQDGDGSARGDSISMSAPPLPDSIQPPHQQDPTWYGPTSEELKTLKRGDTSTTVVPALVLKQDVKIHMKKKGWKITSKNWTLKPGQSNSATPVSTNLKAKDLNVPDNASDDMKVKFSFHESVKSSKYYYRIAMEHKNGTIFKAGTASEDGSIVFTKDNDGKDIVTITIASLKQMKHLVVLSLKKVDDLPGPCTGVELGAWVNTIGTYGGHKFPINVVPERRRLAETPLGWKPSQDMDWSPDYRQRRR